MAELRVRSIDESEIDTVLADDIEFDGRIEFTDPLLIKGRVNGDVVSSSDLYISEHAVITANIKAGRVSVKGNIHGDVTATERVELFSGAQLEGNVHTPDLIVQSGSRFTGHCDMGDGTGDGDNA